MEASFSLIDTLAETERAANSSNVDQAPTWQGKTVPDIVSPRHPSTLNSTAQRLKVRHPGVLKRRSEDPAARHARLKIEKGKVHEALAELLRDAPIPAVADRERERRPTHPYLPLHLFDADTLEPKRRPEDWVADSTDARTGECYVPAAGLFDRETGAELQGPTEARGEWRECSMIGYDARSRRYLVIRRDSPQTFRLPRLFLCFKDENRYHFTSRFLAALERRRHAEALLRMYLYVESMPLSEDDLRLDEEMVTRILHLALSAPNLRQNAAAGVLLEEVARLYVLTMNRLVFEANLGLISREQDLRLELPEPEPPAPAPYLGVVETAEHDFAAQFAHFSFHTFLTYPEVIQVLWQLREECNKTLGLRLGQFDRNEPKTFVDFKKQQHQHNDAVVLKLRQAWPSAVAQSLSYQLGRDRVVSDVHFDFEEAGMAAYMASPLRRLIKRILLDMEDTLRFFTEDSVAAYTKEVEDAAAATVRVKALDDVTLEYALGDEETEDEEERKRRCHIKHLKRPPPLFQVGMSVSSGHSVINQREVDHRAAQIAAWHEANPAPPVEEGVKEKDRPEAPECPLEPIAPVEGQTLEFERPPEEFVEAVLEGFDQVLNLTQSIALVETMVMERLFWPNRPTLPTVQTDEEWVVAARDRVRVAMTAAIEPLFAYREAYDEFVEFLNVDVDDYLEKLTHCSTVPAADENADDVEVVDLQMLQKTIQHHHLAKQKVLAQIPANPIDLGLFSVDCSSTRTLFADKHHEICWRLLDAHLLHCNKAAIALCEKFEEVHKKLGLVPKDIEQLVELQEYMLSVPVAMGPLETGIDTLLSEIDLLDSFFHRMSEEQANRVWDVIGWPQRVANQMARAEQQIIERKAKYAQAMMDEQVQFMESIVALQAEAEAFVNYSDLGQVEQVASHVQQIEKKLAEADELAKLYNSREMLFEKDVTDYEALAHVKKTFEPYSILWGSADTWLRQNKNWMHGAFVDIAAEGLEAEVHSLYANVCKALKFFDKTGVQACAEIATTIKGQIDDFKPDVPLIVALRNPGMRDRHWHELSSNLGFELQPNDDLTLSAVLDLNLRDHLDLIIKISEAAGKEHQIEHALDNMLGEWEGLDLQILSYRETGTYVLRGVDDIQAVLDEHITMTQAMQFSAFKKPFEERIDAWDRKLATISEVLDEWMAVQRNWLYLQPIFESPDINKQLPMEGKRFATVDKSWRQTLSSAKAKPAVLEFCDNEKLHERFWESNKLLDMVQKGLSDYLETKRAVFARFYFLSNDELLSILSETKDVQLVQPHLKKCFEGINRVHFEADNTISAMISAEGERVEFNRLVDPDGKNVEAWMVEVEDMMRESVRDVLHQSIVDYTATPRTKWVQKWPGMCVLNGSQLHWTREMEEKMLAKGAEGVQDMLAMQLSQLEDMVVMVRSPLDKMTRITMGALTVIDVHARDVTKKLVHDSVKEASDFMWSSQLRYYWEDDMFAEMVSARRPYGYEYLGNSFRLVITPLTDKCYLTLMGALQMTLGGAPAGPAGTGKTETTKDLAKALAKQCVVFNCSDGLDYIAMGKFFKGLASCGAWACFDEFNRIDIEVLSVVGQQITTLQQGIRAGETNILFEDSQIRLDAQFGVFITMNPGYAGRTELPDSLKALFRPVAMMVPDYALIGEIMFFAYGFAEAKICGAKMVTTFKLCSEQLSAQCHYDYGMRAVKTVITAAGNLKRADPDMDEHVLLLRALQDVNLPKFLAHDIPLFQGIISDLFPGKARPEIDLGALVKVIKLSIEKQGLQPHPFFMTKVVQLYETICVRHGLMVVGPTGGGKSSNLNVLRAALTELKARGETGYAYETTTESRLNPKSITMGQLYGEFDPNTHEWQDGILSQLYRQAASDQSSDRKWIVFDGPVDAIWIENMNTVLDDNKKLCLNSGEMLQMSDQMSMIFEVEDLSVASPATVSRVGMVYMEPSALGLDPIVQSWLERLPECIPQQIKIDLLGLFDAYLWGCLQFVRAHVRELVPTVDNNLAASLMRLLDCFLERYQPKEGRDPPTQDDFDALSRTIEPVFMFCVIWSIGATTDGAGRAMFDSYIRSEMWANRARQSFPMEGVVYDYSYDLQNQDWVHWMETVDKFEVDSNLSFAELVVPTMDTVRNTFLLDLLLMNNKHVLCVGSTGTGKTVNIQQYLQGSTRPTVGSDCIPLAMTFSARTSANQTQDFLDSKMEKRRKGLYGPSAGKRFIIYVDDLNMPKREKYFAQPPIELLRQWFDQAGWYDRKTLTFRNICDIVFVTSMGPPGGGRNPITSRFVRQFNVLGFTEMSDQSKTLIFSTIVDSFFAGFQPGAQAAAKNVVSASLAVYNTISRELLPTPSKSHYTFNLRDLAKVFQGMLMCDSRRVVESNDVVRLWVHESKRIFADRLVNKQDHEWFQNLLETQVKARFGVDFGAVVTADRLFYGDYMNDGGDKVYQEVQDMDRLVPCIEEYLADHNATSKSPMPLVMFLDAIEHVSRIARILRQPQGNALLLGVGGSGRQSMTKLATYISEYALFQVEISKGYGVPDWRDDVKRCLLEAGLKDEPLTFLFSDVQIIDEIMLEDINNILNAGDVPNLYGPEDMDNILTACRVDCQKKRIAATKINIFAQYILRVRRNIHVCLCMSPIGDVFRERLRMFPSLVNCCSIDWFSEWPAEALHSVAMASMTAEDLKLGDSLPAVVDMFQTVHQSVEAQSKHYYETLRRRNYVTPTSYLELLSTFKTCLHEKRAQVLLSKARLQNGLDKLRSTKSQVKDMQDELVELQPQLAQTQQDVDAMMAQIAIDKEEADQTKAKVEVEEAAANVKATETKAIADDAQRDLDEALPALDEAVACLSKLKKADIDEVKSLKTPPSGVKLTMEVACIMFSLKPVRKNIPDQPGKKYDDYWETAQKNLLGKAQVFMDMLINYDKDNIPDRVIQKLAPYVDNPDFTPEAIEKASKACTAICMWALAMNKYHHVARAVEPKKQKLAEAQEELDHTLAELRDAKARLKAVVDRLADLEANYETAVNKKEELAQKVTLCEIQLSNATKLIGGLGGEEKRWGETVDSLEVAYGNLAGDVIVSAATIGYLGAFTSDYRSTLTSEWRSHLKAQGVPHTDHCDIQMTLGEPVAIRGWQLAGLPTDAVSTENGIIMAKARRWPLLIDPQGQANRFIKNLGKLPEMCENGMDVVKLTEKNFLRTLENGVRFGKWVLIENIAEELDAALEPVLLQQKFKQSGQEMIKIGDANIPYNDAFKFFLTTKLPNPHYPPEVCVKVTLLNFTITQSGLEEQLLGVVVTEEQPELAEKKSQLVISNAEMKRQLFELETQILSLLANSDGNILDDTVLIDTLAQSKATSEEIKEKMAEAEETEREIEVTSNSYRSVAYRASLLYFCISDLAMVDPMYQYALPWFTTLFIKAIANAAPSADLDQRLLNLNEYFTYSIYVNVCRSLFESHKLLYSFLLTIKILQGDDLIDPLEWRFVISGMAPTQVEEPNPDPSWIDTRCWSEICYLSSLDALSSLAQSVKTQGAAWKTVFDSNEPQRVPFPEPFQSQLGSLQRMCVLRCLRPDKITEAIQDYVVEMLGKTFIEPPPFDLPSSFSDSVVTTPLIFILSTGSDPAGDLIEFAEQSGMGDKLRSIALGQGQGKLAERMIEQGVQRGDWVLLQNCHLSISWMPELERLCEELDPDKVHPDFRLWLTSMPSTAFPTAVLQNGVKMTKEPPKGLRANLKNTYFKLDDSKLNVTSRPKVYQKLLFGLCFFHANVIERKKFGPLGWNIPYEFNETDLTISAAQLALFLDVFEDVPYQVLRVMTSSINYGGRITDDKDMRTSDVILKDFFTPEILDDDYKFSPSGTYYSVAPDEASPQQGYLDYIDTLPINPEPEVFGMHSNANITCAQTETYHTFDLILSLQPRVGGGGGLSREELIANASSDILSRLPPLFNIEQIVMAYPVKYEDSMNTVLCQEIKRYNALLEVMHSTLAEIQLALRGLVVMSQELEAMGNAIFDQRVPELWESKSYPSLMPLAAWVNDLLKRTAFMQGWVDGGSPATFWLSGFFFPQGFMTGVVQNHARKHQLPIDTVSFSYVMKDEPAEQLRNKAEDGCYINGLFLEGARWNREKHSLDHSYPKELFSVMPVIHLLPVHNREEPTSGVYRAPVYKTLLRTGTLSTTGHSTNFVFWLNIPATGSDIMRPSLVSETNAQISFADQRSWVIAGVACFTALRYS